MANLLKVLKLLVQLEKENHFELNFMLYIILYSDWKTDRLNFS